MVLTLVVLVLLAPTLGAAQEPRDIAPGQTLSGTLSPDDLTQNGRAYDDYYYSAEPGAEARVVVRSGQLAADLEIYFIDGYFDLLFLDGAGSVPQDSLEFTVPDAGPLTIIVIRVLTLANDPGPGVGDYTIELSARPPASSPRAVATRPLAAHPGRQHLPFGVVPRLPPPDAVVRIGPTPVQMKRLEHEPALDRVARYD